MCADVRMGECPGNVCNGDLVRYWDVAHIENSL